MGEKGIATDAFATGGLTEAVAERSASVVERATTVVTSTVADAGTDLVGMVRDKSIDAAADQLLAEGNERLRRQEPDGDAQGDASRRLPPPNAG
jgi:hypothetical protein